MSFGGHLPQPIRPRELWDHGCAVSQGLLGVRKQCFSGSTVSMFDGHPLSCQSVPTRLARVSAFGA